MIIEIKAGTKKDIPRAENLEIKIDGKKIENSINYIEFKCRADQEALWKIGMAEEPLQTRIQNLFRAFKYRIVNFFKKK